MRPIERHEFSRPAEQLAIQLVRILAATPGHALTNVAAKERLCGATLPITDFHRALTFAENKRWLSYSADYLSIVLASAELLSHLSLVA